MFPMHVHIQQSSYEVHLTCDGLNPFCFQNCLSSLWHRFNNMLGLFLGDFGPLCYSERIMFKKPG